MFAPSFQAQRSPDFWKIAFEEWLPLSLFGDLINLFFHISIIAAQKSFKV